MGVAVLPLLSKTLLLYVFKLHGRKRRKLGIGEKLSSSQKKIKTCQLLILCENVECSAWLNVGTRQDGEEQAPKCILATSACFSIRWRPRLTTVRGATAASAPASGSVLLDPARDRCHWRPPPRPGPRSAVPFQPNRALVLLPRTIQLHQGRDETHLVVAGTQKTTR